MTVAYAVAVAVVAVAATVAFVVAWRGSGRRDVTQLRRRQLDDLTRRHGIHDPRPPT